MKAVNDYVYAEIMTDKPVKVSKETKLSDLASKYGDRLENPIVLAKVNNELQELHKTLSEDCRVEFLDITDPDGFRAYQRSIVFLMVYGVKSVLGKKAKVVVEHSINKNYYCETEEEITQDILDKIEEVMNEAIKKELAIEKYSIPIERAVDLSKEFGLYDKVDFLRYRRTANVNFYKIDWFYDYFYGQMIPNVKYIKAFKLILKDNGFLLQFPSPRGNGSLNEVKPVEKISQVFKESSAWSKILRIRTVGELNNIISAGGFNYITRVTEALHEKKISQIADMISEKKNKIVLIAGPSSSGKTTFAERLCIQLRVNGLVPHIISLDNYFLGRSFIPYDEFGQPDYESIDYMNIEQLNTDLTKLLNNERVEMPEFNFLSGNPEYKGNFLQMSETDILVLEGIHGLNEKLTYSVSADLKFKVFISALTQLSIDDHNRIPTTDTRLLRRIVRDNRVRGMDASTTIKMWPSVQRGEAKNIFPFQEEADAMFNSALVYEMCILKQFAEPLLFGIERDKPQYTEARRLIKFLDSFLGISSEDIPKNSILREFIGGSCFHT